MLFSYDKKQKKPVLFISSALSPNHPLEHPDHSKIFEFFVIMAAKLSIELRKLGYDIVLKVPSNQKTARDDQARFIKELDESRNANKYYSAVVIAPFDTNLLENDVATLIYNLNPHVIKIITIDKYFKSHNGNLIGNPGIKAPPFVICDAEAGGRLAAQSLVRYYIDNKLKNSLNELIIIIMEGLDGSDERINGFTNEMARIKNFPNKCINLVYSIYSDLDREKWKGDFDRQKAKNIIKDNFAELNSNNINAIFCCNDEMALGVRDHLCERYNEVKNDIDKSKNEIRELEQYIGKIEFKKIIEQKGKDNIDLTSEYNEMNDKKTTLSSLEAEKSWIENIKVIGYDGILEVQLLIKNNDPWIINSVDVDIDEQVINIVKWINESHESHCSKIDPVKPKLIVGIDNDEYPNHSTEGEAYKCYKI